MSAVIALGNLLTESEKLALPVEARQAARFSGNG